jgi:hypothetical protein
MHSDQSTRGHPTPQPQPHETHPPRGQVVMGPGFYVWDENAREAREWGTELATAHVIASS